jgi:hypothetical protein
MEARNSKRNWCFLGFLAGASTGFMLGLFTADIWRDHGPYHTQVWSGFVGFIGAGFGTLIGIAYQILTTSHKR